jgi:hypothetical protein
MNRKIFLIVAFFAISPLYLHAQPDTLRVLFVGNSYTDYNNLPQLFANLSESGGRPVFTNMSAPGGYWLENHCGNQETISKISQGIWDYVVLQEQSQVPTIDYYRYNSMVPSARWLDSLIVSYNENTAFFMTWGRKYGGQQTINHYSSPVFRDFFHMQDSLNSAYSQISTDLEATLCPVGLAWAESFRTDSTINLWQDDYSHPTLQGSYLAACVFFAVLCERTPVGLPYRAGLTSEEAFFLQCVAFRTVFSEIKPKNAPVTDGIIKISPNPFNPTTRLSFFLENAGKVNIQVYDVRGRKVADFMDGWRDRGIQSLQFNGENLASGVYFIKLQTHNSVKRSILSTKIVLLK